MINQRAIRDLLKDLHDSRQRTLILLDSVGYTLKPVEGEPMLLKIAPIEETANDN